MPKSSLILLISFFILSCSHTKKVTYTAMVSTVADNNLKSGLMRIKSTGKGKKNEDAVTDAEKNAFNAILFTGVPGSPQEQPMIENESKTRASYVAFFQEFYERQGYRKFIQAISNNGFAKDKDDGLLITTVDVTINLDALRKNLKDNNLIFKFTF